MSSGVVSLTRNGFVAEILIDRPQKLNALTVVMLEDLYRLLLQLDEDPEIRVVILHSAGDRAFCVGADIKAWADHPPMEMWRSWVKRGHRVFDALAGLRQPVIAAIQGPALGGGFELAIAADLRIAEQRAYFSLPETGIATCPGWSGSARLNKLINTSLIKELVFTGCKIESTRALQLGLVNAVCAEGQALTKAREMAAVIALRAPIAVQLSKQMIAANSGENSAMTIEAMASGLSALTNDAKEGVDAFFEKRSANFTGE
ncbi:MAG: enoyl-CoA hydratase/isomerase family protein [Oceanospirillaceae bacterium]|nr:enoyl-CoA hydratase/isomerase family protein [Oceanospirillaceae bacterium]